MILNNDTTLEYTREIKIAKNKNKRARTITLEKSLENTHTHTHKEKRVLKVDIPLSTICQRAVRKNLIIK